jgi:mRNA-degrading endonuclease toxin of MazEF toxin-antitoxin module
MENNYKSNKEKLIVKTGEIFWCYLGVNIGSEQNGRGLDKTRPVLIIYKFSETFLLVAPLTSKYHFGDWYTKISFNDSFVILNQIRPIDIKRLRVHMGTISILELEEILNKYIELIQTKNTNK